MTPLTDFVAFKRDFEEFMGKYPGMEIVTAYYGVDLSGQWRRAVGGFHNIQLTAWASIVFDSHVRLTDGLAIARESQTGEAVLA